MRNEGKAVTQSEGISSKKEPEKTLQRDSLPLGVAEGRGPSGFVKSKRDTSTEPKHGGDNSSNSELHRRLGPRPPKPHMQDRRGQRYENKTVHRDTPECCECVVTGAPPEGAVLRVKQPTLRTDEAVWAAAALGFLLVLLALSVLHTRLYQHWRTAPSLYWHHPRHDDDSVADVVRRRLKMLGRKKRRAPQGRRQDFMLLPSSSTEEELE
ncbi:hypothetical protein GJAV_G00058840 [Gymnothorax javanicus]|nr:hypothetical protein GJAV_G00058840 [Gymnothorax javanicus]